LAGLFGSAAAVAGGLVAAGGVDGEGANELVSGEHCCVVVLDEQGDLVAGPGGSDSDAPWGGIDDSVTVDAEVPDQDGFVDGERSGSGLGLGVMDLGWGSAGVGTVGSLLVVVVDEPVEQALEFGEVMGGVVGSEPFLEGLVEAFHFPAGGRVARR